MQLEFGKLEIVEKTFTRTEGAVRTQAYNGLKFRRYQSTKGKKAAEEAGEKWVPFIEEQFFVSNKAFAQLGLSENALTQAKFGNQVFVMVVEDKDGVAKFCRQSTNKDGTLAKKGKMFSNEFLTNDLTSISVIEKDKLGSQYLSLTDVTTEISGLPPYVKAVYLIGVDTTVDESADTEEETAVEADKF